MITITFDFPEREETDLQQLNAMLATMKLKKLKLEDFETYLCTTSDGKGKIMNYRLGLDSMQVAYQWDFGNDNYSIEDFGFSLKEKGDRQERDEIGKWEPERMNNGETLPQILSRSRHIILKHRSKWNEQQAARATILFEKFPRLQEGYNLCMKLTEIFNKSSSPDEARLNLAKWYNEVEKFDCAEFSKVLDTFSMHNKTIINFLRNA